MMNAESVLLSLRCEYTYTRFFRLAPLRQKILFHIPLGSSCECLRLPSDVVVCAPLWCAALQGTAWNSRGEVVGGIRGDDWKHL